MPHSVFNLKLKECCLSGISATITEQAPPAILTPSGKQVFQL
jgi:hypothetical protein